MVEFRYWLVMTATAVAFAALVALSSSPALYK